MKKFFITATDTDAGKTFVACALTQALINKGKRVAVYKPIAAGCDKVNGQLINEDAQLLTEFSNCNQQISDINPITFEAAIAPHIAAENEKRIISIAEIKKGFTKLISLEADINITEGAGGWRLPVHISSTEDQKPIFLSEFVQLTQQDVILVVNMKLGCLNHALLTYQSILSDGLQCVAWVANNASAEPMSCLVENIASLEQLLPIPKIAQLDFYPDDKISVQDKIKAAAMEIDLTTLC